MCAPLSLTIAMERYSSSLACATDDSISHFSCSFSMQPNGLLEANGVAQLQNM